MTPIDAYRNLATDPEFAKLNWDEQTNVRYQLLAKIMQGSDDFRSMRPDQQQQFIMDKARSAVPVSGDPQYDSQVADLAKRYQQMDPNAIRDVNRAVGGLTLSKQFKLARGLIGAAGRIGEAIFGNEIEDTARRVLDTERESKTAAYYSYLASKNPELEKTLRRDVTAGAVGGFVADIGIPIVTTRLMPRRLVQMLGTEAGERIIAQNTRRALTKWGVQRLLPEMFEATTEGAVFAFRELLGQRQSGAELSMEESVAAMAKAFGQGAAFDYLTGFGIAFAYPFFGSMFKAFARGIGGHNMASATDDIARSNPEKFRQLVDQAITGEIDPEVWALQSEVTRDRLWHAANYRKAGAAAAEDLAANPLYRTSLASNQLRYAVRPTENGYRVFDLDNYEQHAFKSLDEVHTFLAPKAVEFASNMTDAGDFLKQHGWLVNYASLSNNVGTAVRGASTIPNERFIDASARVGITAGEAKKLEGLTGKITARRVGFGLDPGQTARMTNMGDVFEGTTPVLKVGGDDGVVIYNRAANPDRLQYAREYAERAIDKFKLKDSVETIARDYLIRQGYDAVWVRRGSEIMPLLPNSQVKYISTLVNPNTGTIGRAKYVLKKGVDQFNDLSKHAAVRRIVEFKLGSAQAKNNVALTHVAASMTGPLRADDVKRLSRMYLDSVGGEYSDVVVKWSNNTDGMVSITKNKSGIIGVRKPVIQVQAPRSIDNAVAQRNFVENMFERLDEVSGKSGTVGDLGSAGVRADVSKVFDDIPRNKYMPDFDNKAAYNKWMKSIVDDLGGNILRSGDKFVLELPNKGRATFKSMGDLYDGVLASTIDTGQLKAQLAAEGLRLVSPGSGKNTFRVYGRGRTALYEAKNIPALLSDMNYRPKLDIAYSPKFVGFAEGGDLTFQFEGDVAIGPKRKVLQFLDNFVDTRELETLSVFSNSTDGKIFKHANGSFEVQIPSIGFSRRFDNAGEARKFLDGQWEAYHNLKDTANRRGLYLTIEPDGFTVNDGVQTLTASTYDDLYKILKSYPDPKAVPDLIPPDIMADIDAGKAGMDMPKGFELHPLEHYADPSAPMIDLVRGDVPGGRSAAYMVQALDSWLGTTIRKLGKHSEVLENWREVERMRKLAGPDIQHWKKLAQEAFSVNGKPLSQVSRNRIYYHTMLMHKYKGDLTKVEEAMRKLSASEAAEIRIGPLTATEAEAARKMRTLLDGLHDKLNMDPNKYLNEYLPLIRKWFVRGGEQVDNATLASDITAQVWKGSAPPKEIKFMAEYDRAGVIINMAMEDDPLKLVNKYIDNGFKKFYMNEPWKNIVEYLGRESVPPTVHEAIYRYRENIMGFATDATTERVQRIGEGFMKALFPHNKELHAIGKDIVREASSVLYMTQLGWRPWIVMRNMFQIFSTLAPHFGNDAVGKAIQHVWKNGDEVYTRLMKLGIIHEAPPLTNELSDLNNMLNRVSRRSMQMFANSDQFTRAIAFITAEMQFDEAIQMYQKGLFKNTEDFLEYSHINVLQQDFTNRIVNNIVNGDLTKARVEFANGIQKLTMFDYDRAVSPRMAQGFIGKIFGQYGTYPVQYTQNIVNGLTRGTPKQRLAFATRFLANGAALYLAFSQVLGVQATNFLPFVPSTFSGGPMWNLGNKLIDSLDVQSYQGRQARAEVNRLLLPVGRRSEGDQKRWALQYPEMAPGSFQWKAMTRAIEYLDRGEPYLAWLSAFSVPLRRDLRAP